MIVKIEKKTQINDANGFAHNPKVNCKIAVKIANVMDQLINHDKLSKGLRSFCLSISSILQLLQSAKIF